MCVIMYKPSGSKFPSANDLLEMEQVNSDGMGLMYVEKGRVHGEKFVNFDTFLERVRQIPKKQSCILHFRLATHGGKGLKFAHPFPIPVKKREELFYDSWEAPMGIMHNGVISGYGASCWDETVVYEDGEKISSTKEDQLSDTQEFLLYLCSDKKMLHSLLTLDKNVLRMMELATLDKWAILRADGKVRLLGKWTQRKGLWFSNMYWVGGWKSVVYEHDHSYSMNAWERDDISRIKWVDYEGHRVMEKWLGDKLIERGYYDHGACTWVNLPIIKGAIGDGGEEAPKGGVLEI